MNLLTPNTALNFTVFAAAPVFAFLLIYKAYPSAIFEPGEWISPWIQKNVSKVPLRMTEDQKKQEDMDLLMNYKRAMDKKQMEDELATADGLLLNELKFSPKSVMVPLLVMLNAMNDLANCPPNSQIGRAHV